MNRASRNLRFSEDLGDRQRLNIFIVFSLFIHIFFISLSLILPRKDNHALLPPSYVVDLISPVETSGDAQVKATQNIPSSQVSSAENQTRISKLKEMKERSVKEKKDSSIKEEQYLSERIAAIKAKKRIEQIAGIRKTISLQSGSQGKKESQRDVEGRGGGPEEYYSKITSEIWKHWVYPDMDSKVLEAIIVIKIRSDGSVKIKGIEKSSGNGLFDRSAIRAITKASPLTPPPYEMEIGVRFYP